MSADVRSPSKCPGCGKFVYQLVVAKAGAFGIVVRCEACAEELGVES